MVWMIVDIILKLATFITFLLAWLTDPGYIKNTSNDTALVINQNTIN